MPALSEREPILPVSNPNMVSNGTNGKSAGDKKKRVLVVGAGAAGMERCCVSKKLDTDS